MPINLRSRPGWRRCTGSVPGLAFEQLESRLVPATLVWPGLIHPVREAEPNDTLDQAQSLGDLSLMGRAEVVGKIGDSPAAAADVDWYSFTLEQPARVTLITLERPANSPFVSVLSLYNRDVPSPRDPYNALGQRLLAQDNGELHGGDARIERSLAAGAYFVAVSGSGNRYYHPLIAGSGYPGSTGDYGLQITAVDLGLRPADGPAVLVTDPAPEADLDRSPFVLRVDLSAALDPGSVVLGNNVQLVFNSAGRFGDGSDEVVPLAQFNFSTAANELQLQPAAPLKPGYYKLLLAGDALRNSQVLRNPAGQPLGKDRLHDTGYDSATRFRISGVKGNNSVPASAGDTPTTAYRLGDLVGAGFIQIAGAIGTDPTNPIPFSPSDVTLYHFKIAGPGRYAFSAEAFAGRIGSPLNPALTLFRFDATDHGLHLVGANDDTFNDTPTHTRDRLPLFTDAALFAGLTAGEYYLAVSSSGNMPDPAHGLLPGSNGIFDPLVSHSGRAGDTTGEYVLTLSAVSENEPPRVASVGLQAGGELRGGMILAGPPAVLVVDFNKEVNLPQLALQAYLGSHQGRLDAVYVRAADGTRFYPRFGKQTDGRRHAEFLMQDALPNGAYELHLSGALGLTDLAGNPLMGNDPTGDYVIAFAVNGPARGTSGNPLRRSSQEPNHDPPNPQDLGILFPTELENGVVIVRDYTANPGIVSASSADYYRLTVLEPALYRFTLNITGTSADTRLSIRDPFGKPVFSDVFASNEGGPIFADLVPGTYVIGLAGWSPDQAGTVSYQLSIWTGGIDNEPPPPLTVGPGPASRIRHITSGAPPLPTLPPIPAPESSNAPPAVLVASSADSATTGVSSSNPVAASIHDLGSIPSSILLALGVGPKGGIGGETDAQPPPRPDVYERLLSRGPDLAPPESLVHLPILLQTPHSGTAQRPLEPSGLASLVREIYRSVNKARWRQVIEFLYRLDPAAGAQKPLPSEASGSEIPDIPKSSDPSTDSDDLLPNQTTAGTGPQTLLVAGALAGLCRRRERSGKGAAMSSGVALYGVLGGAAS